MCNQPNFKLCPVCGIWIDSYGRCNCNSRKRVNLNSRIIAAVAGIVFAASLFLSPAAKAQDVQPTPTPTTAVGGGPQILDEHHVYLPVIQFPAEVHGCDDCQAVSWRPTGDMKW